MTSGPYVGVEGSSAPLDVHGTSSEGDSKLAHQRYEAGLVAPVPESLLGGLFVIKGDAFVEKRAVTAAGDAALADLGKPGVAAVDLIYLPHPMEGAPRVFLGGGRYGAVTFKDQVPPMSEYFIGTDIADVDMPFHLRLSPSDRTWTSLLVRMRHFPGFDKWLYYAGYRLERASGWFFDAAYPSHVLLGFKTYDDAWSLYAGQRWVSREYPFKTELGEGWMDGYTSTRLVGVRRVLVAPVYLSLEAGLQSEFMRFAGRHGEELAVTQTRYAPWARLGIETWFNFE